MTSTSTNTETTTIITERTRFNFELYKVITLFVGAIAMCGTALSVYYDSKESNALFKQKIEIEMRELNRRIEQLEQKVK